MNKLVSYLIGSLIAGLAIFVPPISGDVPFNIKDVVVPNIGWGIPVMVNSSVWVYLILSIGLASSYIMFTKMHPSIRLLVLYCFCTCFVSMIPFMSFNFMAIAIAMLIVFMLTKYADIAIVTRFVEAIFLFQIVLMTAQYFGKDTLLNFGNNKPVAFGTVMQNMRLGSLFCLLAPFLIYKSRWYIIPLAVSAIWVSSSSFALAIVGGAMAYVFLKKYKHRWLFILGIATLGVLYSLYDYVSFQVAIGIGRIPRWLDILYTWSHNTLASQPTMLHGDIDWKSIVFGRGLNTFSTLFPYYVHDPNPFPHAHNSFLELLWDIGLAGFTLMMWGVLSIVKKLYKNKESILLAGLVFVGINYMLAFPDKMYQTNFLLITYLAFCYWRVKEKIYGNDKQVVRS